MSRTTCGYRRVMGSEAVRDAERCLTVTSSFAQLRDLTDRNRHDRSLERERELVGLRHRAGVERRNAHAPTSEVAARRG